MNKIYIFENTDSLHVEESLKTLNEIFSKRYSVIFCLNEKSLSKVSENIGVGESCVLLNSYYKCIKFFLKIDPGDLVIYPTISARNVFIIYLLSFFISKNIYYIRNSNSWLKYSNHHSNFFYKLLSIAITFMKKKLIRKSFQIFVANRNLKEYLVSHGVKSVINIVPYKVFDFSNVKYLNNYTRLQFVIPGGVDTSKKDLMLVRNAVNSLSISDRAKIKIVLLGKPASNFDFCFCEQWENEIGNTLQFYKSFIPVEEFTEVMKNSHFVLGLLNISFQDKYNCEIYGVSKDTGVDAQAIAYGKPLIINSEFSVVDEIKTSSIGFDDHVHLTEIFKMFINSDKYPSIAKLALLNSKKLSVDGIKNKLIKI